MLWASQESVGLVSSLEEGVGFLEELLMLVEVRLKKEGREVMSKR